MRASTFRNRQPNLRPPAKQWQPSLAWQVLITKKERKREREKDRKRERVTEINGEGEKERRRKGEKERKREGAKERMRNAKALHKNHATLTTRPSFPNLVRCQADATGRVIQAAANSLFNVSFLVASMLFFR